MNILVTGGAGFIGRHLVDALRQQGHAVWVVDPALQEDEGDDKVIACRVEHMRPLDHDRWDVIYHLGSPVGTYGVVQQAGTVASRILAASSAVADLALTMDARVVNVSTSEVYGRTGYSAEDEPCEVPARHSARLAYATGKLAAENDLHTSGANVRTVRPFNVAGPGQKAETGFVIPRWCQAALAGEPVTVFGDGSLERAFCHVYDFVTALLRYLDADQWPLIPAVVNVGNPLNRTSMLHLSFRFAGTAAQALGREVHVERVDGKDVFGPDWEEAAGQTKLPVIEQARIWLGWMPELDLTRIILDTLAYERDRRVS